MNLGNKDKTLDIPRNYKVEPIPRRIIRRPKLIRKVPPPSSRREPTLEYRSFAGRTYELLDVKASKEWLNENGYTVTENPDDTLQIAGNRVSLIVSKGFRHFNLINGVLITEDDEGNIRVGFSRKN
ncbi:MAG: hypothetical protein OXI24_02645 [Candidatus Poribacteria bacterium]|nr:hypothetical protein [Candidatus Poribacteria bacterium]